MKRNLETTTSPKNKMSKPETINDDFDEDHFGQDPIDLEEDF